jgi:hypothetical protein
MKLAENLNASNFSENLPRRILTKPRKQFVEMLLFADIVVMNYRAQVV